METPFSWKTPARLVFGPVSGPLVIVVFCKTTRPGKAAFGPTPNVELLASWYSGLKGMRPFEAVSVTSMVRSTMKWRPLMPSISPAPGTFTVILSWGFGADEALDGDDPPIEFICADACDAITGPQAY